MTAASIVIAAVVPLLSVLLGAALTYWLNVRARRETLVEDLFNSAVAAVSVADASKSYLRSVARPPALSGREYRGLLAEIAKAAVDTHTKRCGEAREALARVVPYEPTLRPFYQDAEAVTTRADEIISLLQRARDARFRGSADRRRRATSRPAGP